MFSVFRIAFFLKLPILFNFYWHFFFRSLFRVTRLRTLYFTFSFGVLFSSSGVHFFTADFSFTYARLKSVEIQSDKHLRNLSTRTHVHFVTGVCSGLCAHTHSHSTSHGMHVKCTKSIFTKFNAGLAMGLERVLLSVFRMCHVIWKFLNVIRLRELNKM